MKGEYFAGKHCTCAAYSSSECACNADWTDPQVYELQKKIETVVGWCNDNIENQTQVAGFALQVREHLSS